MSIYDLWCKPCRQIVRASAPFGRSPVIPCPWCAVQMERYFGKQGMPYTNLGFREDHYDNQTDRDIAKFQFTNDKH